MLDDPQRDFRTAELDAGLLSTPFGVQTNWHVMTGAACSGKTTLIKELADRGFRTVPEIGRVHIEREMAKGRTMDEIRTDGFVTERAMLELQRRFEHRLRVDEIAFLDRGAPDCLTYCRLKGLNPNQILAECFHNRYASVFILDRFPFKHDAVRTEDDATADFLDAWLARDYGALGYDDVRVPVLSPEERLTFLPKRLSKRGLT